MGEFIPANSLEIELRTLLRDKQTPVWKFYTPLAAAQLFIITRNYPELDGSDLVAPTGRNPEVCILSWNDKDYIGIYTSAGRVKLAFDLWKLSQSQFTFVSAKGWQLLRYLSGFDAHLLINAGLKECQYWTRSRPDRNPPLAARTSRCRSAWYGRHANPKRRCPGLFRSVARLPRPAADCPRRMDLSKTGNER
jgi:hypothetical protein